MARKTTKTPSPISDPVPQDTKTDAATAKAEAMLNGGGESAAPSSRSSTDRVRAYRERKKQKESGEAEITEAEVAAAAGTWGLIWEFAVVPLANGRLRPLNEDQAERLGRVSVPLVRKYAPLLGDWQAEVTAVAVLGVVIKETWIAKPKPTESETLIADDEPNA